MVAVGTLSAAVDVVYPDSNIRGMVALAKKVEVRERWDNQTVITIHHVGTPEYYRSSLVTGSPVEIRTSSRAGTKSWFGYVVDANPVYSDGKESTEIVALGVTYPMKRTSTKVWGPQSVAKTMSDIIYSHGLTPFIEDTGLMQTVPQAGRTDFETLVDLGNAAGLYVFTTGTTVNCLSADATVYYFHDEAARLVKASPNDSRNVPDGLDTFEVTNTMLIRSHVRGHSVDPVTASISGTEYGEGAFTDQGVGVTARSLESLQTKVAAVSNKGQSPRRATATGPGNVLVAAGKPVWVNNRGDAQWWRAEEVTHTFNPERKSHRMTAKLVSTSGGWDYPTPTVVPQRGTLRELPNYCMCTEYDPLLVGPTYATYVTNEPYVPDNDYTKVAWADVSSWIKARQQGEDSLLVANMASLRRWKARGRCR